MRGKTRKKVEEEGCSKNNTGESNPSLCPESPTPLRVHSMKFEAQVQIIDSISDSCT